MASYDKHFKFIQLPLGLKKYTSPLFIVGNLIAAGVEPKKSHKLSEVILEQIPAEGISEHAFFELIMQHIPVKARRRFVQLDLFKKYFVSQKSTSPFFLFLGGFTGKTFLSTHLQQHLAINRVLSLDDDKYVIRSRFPDHDHLWKATYEDTHVYEKTVHDFYPRMVERLEENMHDYSMHRKWIYFWEGIYLSPEIIQKFMSEHPETHSLTVMLIADFEEIKRRYIIRWMTEFGEEYIEKNKEKIDFYLSNIYHIMEQMLKNAENENVTIIDSWMFEETIDRFYDALHARIERILKEKDLFDWVERIVNDPPQLQEYIQFLKKE